MKFRRSGPALLISCTIVVVFAITAVAQLLTGRLLESAHDGDYKLMRQVFNDTLGDAEDEVLSRAEVVAAMPEIRAALAARDRPKLAATHVMWELQEQRYELDDAQFHVPPGVSFLRLHKPELFGDDQTSYRPMLADVHQQKVVKKGLAIAIGARHPFPTARIRSLWRRTAYPGRRNRELIPPIRIRLRA